MINDGGYPTGAQHDSRAPWNQSRPEAEDFDMRCNQVLTKSMPVCTTNYTEEVEEEADEDGGTYRSVSYNTDNIDWKQEFADNGYHTPLELLGLFKQYLEDIRDGTKKASYFPSEINYLISECENWEEVETSYEEA